jgi:hypothetical protein
MAQSLVYKFRNHLPAIREALDNQKDLREDRKLYKKIYKYYKDVGVIFTGDSEMDYETLLDCIYEDMV